MRGGVEDGGWVGNAVIMRAQAVSYIGQYKIYNLSVGLLSGC